MKTNKKMKHFLKKHFYKIRIFNILLGTIIMFYAFYFSNRPATLETLIKNKKDPMMYLCLLISFGVVFLINYMLGDFNKKNIKKMTTMEENEE